MSNPGNQNITLRFVNGRIKSFEESTAILKLEDGQTLRWPKSYLPEAAAVGTCIKLKLMTDTGEESEREELAKAVLNKILKGSK